MKLVAGLDPVSLCVIGLGSALGGTLRLQLEAHALARELLAPALVIALINVSGAGLMGWIHAVTLGSGRWPLSTYWRQGLLTGVLGGYTTFSVLSAVAWLQASQGLPALALINLYGSLVLAVLAAWVGLKLGSGPSAEDAATDGQQQSPGAEQGEETGQQ